MARGISGKLLLMEKHPFITQLGVVIAIAPLAGLSVSSNNSTRYLMNKNFYLMKLSYTLLAKKIEQKYFCGLYDVKVI